MLKNHLLPQLRSKRIMSTTTFQHDGAPPHFSQHAREFISNNFSEDCVIGRGFGHSWPPCSPDLSPVDYYFWGTLKASFKRKNQNINSINEKLMANLHHPCEHILQQNGSHIQHLL